MLFTFVINLVSRWDYDRSDDPPNDKAWTTRHETPIYRTTGVNCNRKCKTGNATFSVQQLEHKREHESRYDLRFRVRILPDQQFRKQISVFFIYHKVNRDRLGHDGTRWGRRRGLSGVPSWLRIAVIIVQVIFRARRKREEREKVAERSVWAGWS